MTFYVEAFHITPSDDENDTIKQSYSIIFSHAIIMPPPSSSSPPHAQKPLDKQAIIVMVLLALQFGLQPILTRRFTPSTVCKSSVILCQEVFKFGLAASMLYMSGNLKSAISGKIVVSSFIGVCVMCERRSAHSLNFATFSPIT